jgi:hypothetical protein
MADEVRTHEQLFFKQKLDPILRGALSVYLFSSQTGLLVEGNTSETMIVQSAFIYL